MPVQARPQIKCEILTGNGRDFPPYHLAGTDIYMNDGFEIYDIVPAHELCNIGVKDMSLFTGRPDVRVTFIISTKLHRDDFFIEAGRIAGSVCEDLQVARCVAEMFGNSNQHDLMITGEKAAARECKNLIMERFMREKAEDEEMKLVLNKAQMIKLRETGALIGLDGAPDDDWFAGLNLFAHVLINFRGAVEAFDRLKEAARVLSVACDSCGNKADRISPSTCEHAFCPGCLTQWVVGSEKLIFCCPRCALDAEPIRTPVSMHLLRLMLTEADFARATRRSMQRFLDVQRKFFVCPTQGCGALVQDEAPYFTRPLHCPGCLERSL